MPDDTEIAAQTSSGPHEFRPIRWWDRRAQGRCFHCYNARELHPVTGWVPARPWGDKTPARTRIARAPGR